MRNVMMKAQYLAEAIVDSEAYRRMKQLEGEVRHDEEASAALKNMQEKRRRVEDILSSVDMNPAELKNASAQMHAAEEKMNGNPKIQELKEARREFQNMMDNVNKILRLVVTGEVEEDAESRSRCGGSCAGCSGCN